MNNKTNYDKINLTQYTDAGGCGCKIAPKTLSEIIQTIKLKPDGKNSLAGNYYSDDAAVIKIDKTKAIVFTDDFFTPIVDDPFYFGKIAACNQISVSCFLYVSKNEISLLCEE